MVIKYENKNYVLTKELYLGKIFLKIVKCANDNVRIC